MANIIKQPCDEGVIRSGEAKSPCAPNAGPWVLAATILGTSMAFIDETAVTVALPAIQRALGATAVDAQWVVEAYTLLLAALILAGGSLGDHLGRRRVFAIGIGLFAAASVWCGLASSPEQLIASRAVQGVGGAFLVPNSLAIISASFEEERRGKAIGTWAGFTGITMILGPVLGGYLVENLSWRGIFFINVPLALIVLAITLSRVPESRDEGARKLDLPGAALAAVGLGVLMFASFGGSLDDRLASLDLPPEARQQLEAQKSKLGAAKAPEGVDAELGASVERAIDEAFVSGYRVVMLVAAALAVASALSAALLIEGKKKPKEVLESRDNANPASLSTSKS